MNAGVFSSCSAIQVLPIELGLCVGLTSPWSFRCTIQYTAYGSLHFQLFTVPLFPLHQLIGGYIPVRRRGDIVWDSHPSEISIARNQAAAAMTKPSTIFLGLRISITGAIGLGWATGVLSSPDTGPFAETIGICSVR
ncbi:hypothetical protein I7I48_07433 [Histoplasma ohiense]|nr:hypothetical protein I7I48_07433 [Histoplasma ohiense (nom. inval.)]